MNLIIKIAWRNIQRHRGKSLIIGSILFIGALLMTVGNGVISGMDAGLQKNIVDGFSGDVVLVSDKQETDNVFMEFMGKAVEPINNFKHIDTTLATISYIKKWLPIGKNFAMALNDEGGISDGVFVLGVNYPKYLEFFGDNLKVIEGSMPKNPNEPFVLMPTGWRKQSAEYYSLLYTPQGVKPDTSTLGKEVNERYGDMVIKNSVVYMGMNVDNTTTDVRVPVAAVVKYRALNTIWGNFPILDIESYRECQGYFSATAQSAPVKKETLDLFSKGEDALDDMFADADVVSSNKTARKTPQMLATGSLKVDRDTVRKAVDFDAGTYNLILLRVKDASHLSKTVKQLNNDLADKKLGLRAIPWNKAIGMVGSMAVLIKTSLFVFVMFLFFVAIIIIINTLSMAAIERTTEIGMMRAVGARKGFIRLMFIGETCVLSALFGGLGILVGVIIVNIIAACNITSTNDMVQLLYGGDTFRPLLSVIDIALVIVQLVIVTIVAVIYPVRVASGITPLDAISRD